MPITALYAALLTPLFILLSVRTIAARRKARVAFGPGEDDQLLRRMRAHANFAEYVPLALLLTALSESLGAPAPALHGLGASLLVGRIVHAYALSRTPHSVRFRVVGMTLTFAVLCLGALLALVLAVTRLA
jgi:hypothetical protein